MKKRTIITTLLLALSTITFAQETKIKLPTNNNTSSFTVTGTDTDRMMKFFADGGFYLNGELNEGTIPIEGTGARLMWYPKKAAFRAGRVTSSTYWGDDNIGDHSIALGVNTIASGEASTSMGARTIASGYASTSIGKYNIGLSTAIFEIGIGDYSARKNALTVQPDGDIGIGTTDPDFPLHIKSDKSFPGSAQWDHHIKLEVSKGWWTMGVDDQAGDADFIFRSSEDDDGYTAFIEPASGDWNITSDRRLKKTIEPLRNILEKIEELEPVSYLRLKDKTTDKREIGFIAQDVNKLFPDNTIAKKKDKYWSLSYSSFGPLAIAGIKELKTEKDREIAELKEKVTKLEEMINILLDDRKTEMVRK